MVERRSQVAESPDPRRSGTEWFLGAVFSQGRTVASLASKSLRRLSEKWSASISSPWFPLLCAGVSFTALLVFTGVMADLALTRQPLPINTIALPFEKPQPIERDYDNDPIAILIEQTSLPEGSSPGAHGSASSCDGQPCR